MLGRLAVVKNEANASLGGIVDELRIRRRLCRRNRHGRIGASIHTRQARQLVSELRLPERFGRRQPASETRRKLIRPGRKRRGNRRCRGPGNPAASRSSPGRGNCASARIDHPWPSTAVPARHKARPAQRAAREVFTVVQHFTVFVVAQVDLSLPPMQLFCFLDATPPDQNAASRSRALVSPGSALIKRHEFLFLGGRVTA